MHPNFRQPVLCPDVTDWDLVLNFQRESKTILTPLKVVEGRHCGDTGSVVDAVKSPIFSGPETGNLI